MTPSVRFIDSSVFVHAYLKPKRPLKPQEEEIKEAAKKIVTRVNAGERVVSSVINLSEISNILEDHLSMVDALSIERALCLRENVSILDVRREDCIAALDEAEMHEVGLNDALVYVLMKRNDLGELYSFDRDFDRFKDVKRLKN